MMINDETVNRISLKTNEPNDNTHHNMKISEMEMQLVIIEEKQDKWIISKACFFQLFSL